MHLHLLRRSSALAAVFVVIMFAIFLATGVGQESLQVVRAPAEYLAKLLANPSALTLTLYADDAFILFYVTVFLSVAVVRWPARASRPWMIAAAVLLFTTGLLDLLENLDFVVLLKNAQLGLGPDTERIASRVGASLLKFHVSYLGLWFLGHALPTTTRLEKALVFALRWVQWPVGFAVALVPQPIAIGLVIVRLLFFFFSLLALRSASARPGFETEEPA